MMPQYLTQPDALRLASTDRSTKLSIPLIKRSTCGVRITAWLATKVCAVSRGKMITQKLPLLPVCSLHSSCSARRFLNMQLYKRGLINTFSLQVRFLANMKHSYLLEFTTIRQSMQTALTLRHSSSYNTFTVFTSSHFDSCQRRLITDTSSDYHAESPQCWRSPKGFCF